MIIVVINLYIIIIITTNNNIILYYVVVFFKFNFQDDWTPLIKTCSVMFELLLLLIA